MRTCPPERAALLGKIQIYVGAMQTRSPGTPSPPVGAGLLAKAVYQLPLMATDIPHSRASPLPQGFMVFG
ncbi:hypothetical protein C1894_09145 [Pseudomonas sp. FW305-3-2-15-E-TSA2]|nr:hypothetical protein C1895_28605 [Pseudomonas sp. FW305-3-2-15-E-TSA4]POA43046.1 hypothetical protein C1894_09145 [Pseudomonas sp. FW305-3-2-15-E-TSA2]